jgi:hypothetical protein
LPAGHAWRPGASVESQGRVGYGPVVLTLRRPLTIEHPIYHSSELGL